MPLRLAARGETSLTPHSTLHIPQIDFVKKHNQKVGSILEKNQPILLVLANERVLSTFLYRSVYQYLVLIYGTMGMPDALNGGAVLIARGGR